METSEVTEFKKNLRKKLLNIYYTQGYEHSIESINFLIKNSNKKAKEMEEPKLGIQIRGECTETLLEINIREFARKNNQQWLLSKGLCLKRMDHKKNGTTELDITLFTPNRVILFESKYRSGKFDLLQECTLVPKGFGYPAGVYAQNILHLNNLRKYLDEAVVNLNGTKPFSICLYMSELKNIRDCREDKFKKLIPLIGPENIEDYLKTLLINKTIVWDMKKMKKIVTALDLESEENFKKHMEGVKKNGT